MWDKTYLLVGGWGKLTLPTQKGVGLLLGKWTCYVGPVGLLKDDWAEIGRLGVSRADGLRLDDWASGHLVGRNVDGSASPPNTPLKRGDGRPRGQWNDSLSLLVAPPWCSGGRACDQLFQGAIRQQCGAPFGRWDLNVIFHYGKLAQNLPRVKTCHFDFQIKLQLTLECSSYNTI